MAGVSGQESVGSSSAQASFIESFSELPFADFLADEEASSDKKMIKIGALHYKVQVEDYRAPEQEEEASVSVPFNPGFMISVNLMDISSFLTAVPEHLRSFASETISFIQQARTDIQKVDYRFRFSQLNLEVLFRHDGDRIRIEIFSNSGADKLFSDEDQRALTGILKDEFRDEEIEVLYTDFKEGESSDSEQDSDQEPGDSDEDPLSDT